MALQTITTIKIGENTITNFSNLKITQEIHKHNSFSLEVRKDLFVEEHRSAMPTSQELTGANISIEIKAIPDLDDLMVFSNPQDYILRFYGIVTKIRIQKSRNKDVEDSILIKGYSSSIIMDNGPESNSFTKMNLKEIVNKVKESYNIIMDISPNYNNNIAYTVQYNESDFDFINRLAMRFGQYFFDNGTKIIFGNPNSDAITPKLVYGVNMSEFDYDIKLIPALFSTIENDNREGEYYIDKTSEYKSEVDGFNQNFISKSNQVFNKETSFQINQNAVGGSGKSNLEEYTKNKHRSFLGKMIQIKASSEVPGIQLGNTVVINGVDPQLEGIYRVTKVTHNCDDGGSYQNHFTAVDLGGAVFSPKVNPDLIPRCESQSAIVIANSDPDGLSGLIIQMPWQKLKGVTTPYVPMLQTYGGNGKGSHWLPEIGEKVFVEFQGNNAEMPIVTGTISSRNEKSGYATPNNDIKALHTRKNNLLVMNDNTGSVLLQDSTKSYLALDGNRRIELNTDVFEINVKNLIINATQSTEIITNDYMLNALSRIYILSKTMKQSIQGFMNLYSGKALINSNDAIDIEAKTAKLHGKEKALFHSDNETVINSKGTAHMHADKGTGHTNTAKEISAADVDTIALAVVYFRPTSSWNGEFGFDWLREDDNGLADPKDPAYKNIIEGGYKDGVANLTSGAAGTAYAQLKTEYQKIPITRKTASAVASAEYFVPYLTLFSREFVASMPRTLINTPVYEADLKILLDIEEDLKELKFDYDKSLFTLSIESITANTKTNGLEDCSITVKITCLKDLHSDKEICIYAYPKNAVIDSKSDLEPSVFQRKLAGKIIVLRNDISIRKNQKFVLVPVKTNLTTNPRDIKKGKFSPLEQKRLQYGLHQSLVTSEIKIGTMLDLSNDSKFQVSTNSSGIKTYGEYIFKNTSGSTKHTDGNICQGKTGIYDYVKNLYIDQNPQYRDCFPMFIFDENTYDSYEDPITGTFSATPGQVQDIKIKNVFLFNGALGTTRDDYTMSHEGLHGLGLYHTHFNSAIIKEADRKYVFADGNKNPANSTDNIMSYGDKVRKSTWKWQWDIVKSNA